MKILTKENARELLNGKLPDEFVTQLAGRLELAQGTYSAPVNSGVQIALSKLFAYLLLKDSPVCIYVTGWGVANEHADLFNGYRRSLGESRPLIEAPVHVFERTDEDAFISLLCMVFFFSWDASVFDTTGRSLLQTSHDGWLEARGSVAEFRKEVAAELQAYRVPLLAR
jgi:hypothetical protein